ncbi:hypothetical protein E2C01_051785 [Portunus trituberculatus]|uniref:Uncharacterized protein n=1 Tax=Portunus trituberculatus TaxID=210409 RepID=A0A5B7GKH6_PORTR|nr:hypothetical protein [Portunus trituberculatus]
MFANAETIDKDTIPEAKNDRKQLQHLNRFCSTVWAPGVVGRPVSGGQPEVPRAERAAASHGAPPQE